MGVDVIYYPDDPRPAFWRRPIVALGNFDGLHRGHQKIVERVCRQAREQACTPVVMTFDPHPPRIVRPDKAPPLLMTNEQKVEALGREGIEGVAFVRFTRELSQWEPETFVRLVIAEWLHPAEVWVGANFLFGRDRSGNFSLLRTLGVRYGFRAEKIDPVRYREFVVSSTRIRRLISEGRVDEAGALLGHYHFIDGRVARGAGRGRQIGFPTANIETENELLPPQGVYATTLTYRRQVYRSVTNIGVRPTFGTGGDPVIETHIFGLDEDLYGATVRLAFVQRMRPERAFPDVDALVAQIRADTEQAQALFDRLSP
ncbi:MAG TPA: bifunctional riboflavin kinase/FAD synthetase [Vicinamibacterales bacterium]